MALTSNLIRPILLLLGVILITACIEDSSEYWEEIDETQSIEILERLFVHLPEMSFIRADYRYLDPEEGYIYFQLPDTRTPAEWLIYIIDQIGIAATEPGSNLFADYTTDSEYSHCVYGTQENNQHICYRALKYSPDENMYHAYFWNPS